MEISVCIITKNESEKLKKCLESIKPYGFEIVVVDTGSTDDTGKIMEEYADVTGDFKWCDDFSKARNYSIQLAKNDWILVLDSDEWMEQCDVEVVRRHIMNNPYVVGRVERINDITSLGQVEKGHEHISRLFHRNYYEYKGRIHEQLCRKESCIDEPLYCEVPIVIGHSGYLGTKEERRNKAQRNIDLLLLDLEEYGPDPYVFYQLGKGYYMQGEYEQAAKFFEEGLGFDLDPKLEYVQDMVETYGYALLQLKRYDEMLFLEAVYDEFALSSDYMLLMGLAYMNNEMFDKAIAEFEKATRNPVCKVEGCNSYKALYNAGVICECLGRHEEARGYYERCGTYELAQKGLLRIGIRVDA
ncbi:MAG: glycosyltransferase [Lachnospiraceae bacterium]